MCLCRKRRSPLSVLVMAVCVLLVPGPLTPGPASAAGTHTEQDPAGTEGGGEPPVSGPAEPEPEGGGRTEEAGPAGSREYGGRPEDSPDSPTSAAGGSGTGEAGATTAHGSALAGASAEVARLYERAAEVTAAYGRSLRAADAQRAVLARLREQLDRRRGDLAVLRDAVGAVARDQYRTGGQLTATAGLLLARDPDQLMHGRRAARQAETAVRRLLARAAAAEARLETAEERARRVRQDLDARTERLARVRKGLERSLEAARWRLRSEAAALAAAGTCAGPAGNGAGAELPPEPDGGAGGGPAWVAPVDRYRLSAGFGSGGARWVHRHTGQDFAVDTGTPVRSVGAGRVQSVSCGGAFGIQIVVQHPGGYYTQYAHLSAVTVGQGLRVGTGQVIGLAGSTGNSTGPHLHFEVRLTPYLGSGVDPAGWLRERGVSLISEPGP
ncbi:peptidoglycan DD-metalloendopeptidase family protein [Streptomyces sp. NPDC003691]